MVAADAIVVLVAVEAVAEGASESRAGKNHMGSGRSALTMRGAARLPILRRDTGSAPVGFE